MQTLGDGHGFNPINHALRIVQLQLGARPETAELVDEVATARAAVRAAEEAYQDQRSRRVAATATLRYLDDQLDQAVGDLSRDMLAALRNDRTDARYRLAFPKPVSVAMRPLASEAQTVFVRSLLAELQTEQLADWADRAPAIAAALDAVEAQRARRAELYATEAQANARRQIAFDDARRGYNLLYPRLQVLFPKNKALVESFFPAL